MKRQISSGIILSFFSQVIGMVVGLAYTPIMIHILGQNEYGLYQLVLSVVSYLNLMNFGFNGAYIRYYTLAKREKNDDEVANVNGMFMKVFLILAILCLIAGVILFLNIGILGEKLSSKDYEIAKKLLIIMVTNLALSFPNSVFVAYMSANESFIYQKTLAIIINIAVPILNIPLLLLGMGSVGVVSVTLLLTIIRLILNIWYCFIKLDMKINIRYYNKKIFKGLLGYTFFIFLSDIVDQLNSNIDKMLLGRMMGTIATAVYSVGFNLKEYYTTVSWIIPEMFVPEANRLSIEKKRNKELNNLFIKCGKLNNYIILLVLSLFFVVGQQFIILWVGEEYTTSYYASLILMLSGYIPAVQTLGVNIQNAKNMHRVRSIVYFFVACINVIVSIFLIKKLGVLGTCLGTLVAVLLGHGMFMNWYYYRIGLDIVAFWKEMLNWIIPVGISTICYNVILKKISIDTWFKLFIFCGVYVVVYLIMVYTISLNLEQKSIINKMIRK